MALRRRACGARNIVLAYQDDDGKIIADPSIDLEKSNIKAYWDSFFDEQYIVEDGSATRFVIKGLSDEQKEESEGKGFRRVVSWYLRCGINTHSNYDIEDDNGNIVVPKQPDKKDMGRLGKVSSEEWLFSMRFTNDSVNV